MKRLILGIVAVVVVGCSENGLIENTGKIDSRPVISNGGRTELLPLAKGNYWKLASGRGALEADTTMLMVIGDTVVNNITYKVVSSTLESGFMLVRLGGENEMYMINGNNQEYRFDAGAADGYSYQTGDRTVTLTRYDTLVTEAGTFLNCIEFATTPTPYIDENGVVSRWKDADWGFTIAPGIGFVSKQVSWFGYFLLTSFELNAEVSPSTDTADGRK